MLTDIAGRPGSGGSHTRQCVDLPTGAPPWPSVLTTHLTKASIYKKAFGISPVVFGAIPSLHAATAVCSCLFITRYATGWGGYRGLVFMWIYCTWMVSLAASFTKCARNRLILIRSSSGQRSTSTSSLSVHPFSASRLTKFLNSATSQSTSYLGACTPASRLASSSACDSASST